MYRYLVASLLGFSLFIGAYYVREAGVEKVFSYDPGTRDFARLGSEDVIGKYLCGIANGCKESYEITLYLNGEAKLTHLGTEVKPEIIERGSWSFMDGGFISLTLTEKEEHDTEPENYETPQILIIQSVSTSTLTKITYNTKTYPLMAKPKFIKQDLF
jgi:hypothetical protein